MESHWIEAENALQLRSAEHSGVWSIRWSGCVPGLYWSSTAGQPQVGPILGGLGLTASGRTDVGELNEKNLVQLEIVRNRVDLSFQPQSWHDTRIRLSWWPSAPGQFDLMTEVSTRSVGLLKGVELGVVSTLSPSLENAPVWLEAFRDQESAMRSIDGRDSNWFKAQSAFQPDESSATLHETKSWFPLLLTGNTPRTRLLETTHPDDISRRYQDNKGHAVRTWTFGYDMERGVVFRGRHRCRIVQPDELVNWNSIEAWHSECINEPLPLFR